MLRIRITSIFLVLVCLAVSVYAQPAKRVDPYVTGETLTYVGKYKKFGFSFAIAELEFKVESTGPDGRHYVVSQGNSKGSLAKLFNFKFSLKIDSLIDSEKLHVEKTTKHDVQGDRVRESEAEFDYDVKRVTYTETDPTDPTRAPRRVASEIQPDTQDIVSAVYRLRGLDLAVGKSFEFKVSDSGLVYDIPIKVTARERVKSELGTRWCWRVEPEIFGQGKIIEQEGSLVIWITDDADRVPVQAKLDTKSGKVHIKLREYSNLRSDQLAAK